MLIQKEEFRNQNLDNNQNNNEINQEEINNNLDELNQNENQNNNRRPNGGGFDIFLSHGLNPDEVRTLRILFHFAATQQSLMTGVPLDWSAEGIYQREERWLLNQLNVMINRNAEANNNYISLNINDNSLFDGRQIIYEQTDLRHVFMIGFLVGLVINIFGILLLFCRFKATFKLGLICGIIVSTIFFSKMFYFK